MKSSTGILTIDLSAIQSNWRCINSQLTGKTSASAVIKANAYGLGAAYVGPALYQAGCREFFVATLEEALAARQYLKPDAVVYVLGGVRPGAEPLFLENDLSPVLFTLEDTRRWLACTQKLDAPPACAIKINTGMTRLGLDLQEWLSLLASEEELRSLRPVLIMSHLACADEPEHPLNYKQLALFQALADATRSLLPDTRFSLANSSGVFLGSQWHFDLVRPGAALYGVNPQPLKPSPLKPVVQLALPVLQVRELSENADVGYGATAQAFPLTRLAVVAGGYADGLHRTIGRQGFGILDNHRVPVVGRISMDTTIFDISAADIKGEHRMIQVLNDELTVDSWTALTGALGYDILTSLGYRYRRCYLKDGVSIEQESLYE